MMSADFTTSLSGVLHLGNYTLDVTSKVEDSLHNMIFAANIPEISLAALATDLLKSLQMELPICLPEVKLQEVSFRLNPFTSYVELLARLNLMMGGVKQSGSAFFLTALADDHTRGYLFGIRDLEIDLQNLPIVGEKFKLEMKLTDGMIIGSSAQFTNPPVPFGQVTSGRQVIFYPGLGFRANLICMGYKQPIDLFPVTGETTGLPIQLHDEAYVHSMPPYQADQRPAISAQFPLTDATQTALTLPMRSNTRGRVKWFAIEKTLGSLQLHRVGIELNGQLIRCILKTRIKVAGIAISLDGLGVTLSLGKLSDLQYTLEGLGITFKGGPLEISGAFSKVEDENYHTYQGSALVRIKSFSLFAVGSYTIPKHPSPSESDQTSLFLFGMISVPIGGPPYFYVKGIALGFGYNRNLIMPELKEVQKFPLVAGVLGEGAISGESKPDEVLQQVNQYLSPASGQYWLAAGIKFSSFGMIEGFGLCSVSFGAAFEVALLGIGNIQVPPRTANPIMQAELALVARFTLAQGVLGITGSLTSASYILSKNCHLTGGFAFYLWFAGQQKGDFVVSLGGYHQDFNKPAHYPTLDRVGLNWRISDQLQFNGRGYFALTPSCLMVGGELDATFHAGQLQAWFTANVHFLMDWKPLHYDSTVGVNIGVTYTFKAWQVQKTISTHLDASLHVWGPEFSGKARVYWAVISFTIEFGQSGPSEASYLQWPEFASSFLPKEQDSELLDICTIRVEQGLIKETKKNGSSHWIVKGDELALVTHSAIPITSIHLSQREISLQDLSTQLGVLPMGAGRSLTSVHRVTVQRQTPTGEWVELPAEDWTCQVLTENIPEALWGLEKVDQPSTRVIANAPSGIVIHPVHNCNYHQLQQLDLCHLGINQVDQWYSCENLQPPARVSFTGDSIERVETTVMKPEQAAIRNQIVQSLQSKGYGGGETGSLEELAKSAWNIFNGQPELVDLTGISSTVGT